MKKILCIVFLLFVSCYNLQLWAQKVDERLPWSVRIVESEMVRFPESWKLDFSKKIGWGYCIGIELEAIWKVYDEYGDERYRDYVISYADSVVQADGSILTYRLDDYNIDQLCSGKLLFHIYEYTKKEKYKKALELLRSQLDTHPRTTEGGFWHKKVYPHQMWLDGLYMGSPFYAEYAYRHNKVEDFQDVIHQFKVVAKHTYDPISRLYRHGWDESKTQKWANKITGQSAHCWGRAMGWYMMALVDVLDFLPLHEEGRDSLITILNNGTAQLAKLQDSSTGLWYQVLDRSGETGNYLEASASSMFVYALFKAVRKGYIPVSYLTTALKGYKGILENLIEIDESGLVSLTQVCEVAGLGGSKNYRMGDYNYYIKEKIRSNDPKGLAPFILASLEYEKLEEGKK